MTKLASFNEIPKELIEKYQIVNEPDCLNINYPAYVNIDIDESFTVTEDGTTINFENNKCIVSIWKSTLLMHVTIF